MIFPKISARCFLLYYTGAKYKGPELSALVAQSVSTDVAFEEFS